MIQASSPLQSKALACLLLGLQAASSLRLRSVTTDTDCFSILFRLTQLHSAVVEIRPILQDVIQLMSTFEVVFIIKIPRNEVLEAHNLGPQLRKL